MYLDTYLQIVQLLILSSFANLWGVWPPIQSHFKPFIIVESLENTTINYNVKQLLKIVKLKEEKRFATIALNIFC